MRKRKSVRRGKILKGASQSAALQEKTRVNRLKQHQGIIVAKKGGAAARRKPTVGGTGKEKNGVGKGEEQVKNRAPEELKSPSKKKRPQLFLQPQPSGLEKKKTKRRKNRKRTRKWKKSSKRPLGDQTRKPSNLTRGKKGFRVMKRPTGKEKKRGERFGIGSKKTGGQKVRFC